MPYGLDIPEGSDFYTTLNDEFLNASLRPDTTGIPYNASGEHTLSVYPGNLSGSPDAGEKRNRFSLVDNVLKPIYGVGHKYFSKASLGELAAGGAVGSFISSGVLKNSGYDASSDACGALCLISLVLVAAYYIYESQFSKDGRERRIYDAIQTLKDLPE